MARDDFHVIVYQILAYLYQRLKKGEPVDPKMLESGSVYFKANGQDLNKQYWAYVIFNMQRLGLIEGVTLVEIDNLKYPFPTNLDSCMITPAGIEYLTENSFLNKAKEFLKDVNAIVPFP